MDYYVWAQYYFVAAAKQMSSDEVRYYHGHKHNVRPTQADISACVNDLVDKVDDEATRRGIAAPTDVATAAEIKTRSAH